MFRLQKFSLLPIMFATQSRLNLRADSPRFSFTGPQLRRIWCLRCSIQRNLIRRLTSFLSPDWNQIWPITNLDLDSRHATKIWIESIAWNQLTQYEIVVEIDLEWELSRFKYCMIPYLLFSGLHDTYKQGAQKGQNQALFHQRTKSMWTPCALRQWWGCSQGGGPQQTVKTTVMREREKHHKECVRKKASVIYIQILKGTWRL